MKNYLIAIDMQNDFIDGSLGTKEAQAIVPKVVERIQKAKEDGWTIAYTLDTHYEDYLETQEGKKLPIPHCITGTKGHALHSDVYDVLKDYTVYEYTKNTFGCNELVDDLCFISEACDRKDEEVNIELIGLCTDICVVSNAIMLKSALPEVNISVNASCCAGVTPELHEASLRVMESCQINII